MTSPNGPGGSARRLQPLKGAGWTDNVARVYEVKRRHPEVDVEWPRVTGREFRASWPADPADPESAIRSVQARDLAALAAMLEKEFPDGG